MIMTDTAKNVHVLIYLNVLISFLAFAPKSSISSINSSHMKAKTANLTLPQKCQGQLPKSSLEHLLAKILKTLHEILCSRIFLCLILPENKSRSTPGHYLNYLGSTRLLIATYQISRQSVYWFQSRILKVFTMNMHEHA